MYAILSSIVFSLFFVCSVDCFNLFSAFFMKEPAFSFWWEMIGAEFSSGFGVGWIIVDDSIAIVHCLFWKYSERTELISISYAFYYYKLLENDNFVISLNAFSKESSFRFGMSGVYLYLFVVPLKVITDIL